MKIGPRLPVLAVLVAVLGVLAVIGPGSGAGSGTGLAAGAADDVAMPMAEEPDVLSSAWYCAAGAADGGGFDLTVVVANPLDEARRGTITWYADGERRSEAINVAAHDVLTLAATDTVEGAQASAVVEIEGGGVAVDHRVAGPGGTSAAPCASAPSGTWHVANGSTARDARQRLYLFNPFPDDAIVDITFAVDGPPEAPPGLQGLAVPPRSTTVVDVGEHVRREDVTAATVETRSGRLVVDRLQYFTGEAGRRGVSLALAAPDAARTWYFAGGPTGEGITRTWRIYNPGEEEAIVLLEIVLETVPDTGEVPEPVERTIRGGRLESIDVGEIPSLEPGSGFSATVRTINDVPVVAEREIDAREPASLRGWSSTLGAPVTAERWLVPGSLAAETVGESIVVYNPSAEPVVASVVLVADGTVADVPEGEAIELGPADRATVPIPAGGERRAASIFVEADGPVTVERHVDHLAGNGIDDSPGIPLR